MADGPVVCDDCGITFPLREGTGICNKCTKLQDTPFGSPAYKEIQAWLQCVKCGVTRRNMPPALNGQEQTCSSNKCKGAIVNQGPNDTSGGSMSAGVDTSQQALCPSLAANNVPTAYLERAAATTHRLKLNHRIATPGTSLNTTTLLNHENGGGLPGEQKIYVAFSARSSKAANRVDADLGSSVLQRAVSCYMPDIKVDIVKIINDEWQRRSNGVPLLPEEVTFRFSGNRVLDPDTSTLTLGQFYEYYNTASRAPIYLAIPSLFSHLKKQKKPAICFEMYIDYSAWNSRVTDFNADNIENDLASVTTSTVSRKRLRTESAAAALEPDARKHHRGDRQNYNVPISHFRPSSRAGPALVLTRSKVTIQKTICVVDAISGACSFVATDEELTGYMFDKPFSSGSMKHAYDFHPLNGDQYVAKRFFKLSDDDEPDNDPATYIIGNKTQIECDLIRIFQGKWFLQAFYKYCKAKPHVPLDTSLEFAEAFLGQEVGRPSRASGLEIADDKDAEGLTWLIERKRPTSVVKYSGTLTHKTSRKDPRSLTISAFAHFVYGYSDSHMIFADIQGSPAQVKGRDGVVLFDVMTHTVDGDSGVGDFGPEGIETFVRDHECGTICRALGLNLVYPLDQAQSRNQAENLDNGGEQVTGEGHELVGSDGDED